MEKMPAPYTPPIRVRLVIWFGIYLFFQFPLMRYAPGFFLFPVGMPGFLKDVLNPHLQNASEISPAFFLAIFIYAFYGIHLFFTLWVRTRAFWILLGLLIVVLFLEDFVVWQIIDIFNHPFRKD